MVERQRQELLTRYARGEITALDLRRQFGGATYGDIFRMLADEGLALPKNPVAGREDKIARAREWLFPKHGDAQ
jgi:hypothetical protein